jgi:hypothetical protein
MSTPRVIDFDDNNFKFMLANMTAHDVIHDYGIAKEERWEANKDLLLQFQRDRYTFMNPRTAAREQVGGMKSIFKFPPRPTIDDSPLSKKLRVGTYASQEPTEHVFLKVDTKGDREIYHRIDDIANGTTDQEDLTEPDEDPFTAADEDPFTAADEAYMANRLADDEESAAANIYPQPVTEANKTFFYNLVKDELAYYNTLDLLVETVKCDILIIIFLNIFGRPHEVISEEEEKANDEYELVCKYLHYYITDGSDFMEEIFYKFVGYLNNYPVDLTDIVNLLRRGNISGIRLFFENPITDIMISQMYQELILRYHETSPMELDGGSTKYTGGASLRLTGEECKVVRLRVYNFMNNIGLLTSDELTNFIQFLSSMNIQFTTSPLGTARRYIAINGQDRDICDILDGDDVRQHIIINNYKIFDSMLSIFIAYTRDEVTPDRDLYIDYLKEIAKECANVFESDSVRNPVSRISEIKKNTTLVPTITRLRRGYEPTPAYFYSHLKNRLLAYLSDYEGIITVHDMNIRRKAEAEQRAEERDRVGHLGPDDLRFREGFCSFIAKTSLHMCDIITAAPTRDNPTQLTWTLNRDILENQYLKRQAEILCTWANIIPKLYGLGKCMKDADTALFQLFTGTFIVDGIQTHTEATGFLNSISRNTTNKIIIDNAAMSRSDRFYKNKFCPWSSINDAQSMCSAGTDDSIEYGDMDFIIANANRRSYYRSIMTVYPSIHKYSITFNIVFPDGNTVTHTITPRYVGDGFLKAKNAVGETIQGIIDYLLKKSRQSTASMPNPDFDQAFTDRVFPQFPNIFDQLFLEFLGGNVDIMQIIFGNILCKLLGDLKQEINTICEHGGYTGDNYDIGDYIVPWIPSSPNTPRVFLANDRPSALRAMFAAHFARSGINRHCAVAYYPNEEHIFMYIKEGATFTGGKTRKRIKLNKKTKKKSKSNRKTKKNKQRNSKRIKRKYYNKYIKNDSK